MPADPPGTRAVARTAWPEPVNAAGDRFLAVTLEFACDIRGFGVERSTTELTGRLAEYARLAEQVKAMRDNIDEIRGTGYSDDGLVTAVVGGRGELVELELDPRIYRDRNATELATKIVAAVHEAAEDAGREATKFAETLLPQNKRGGDIDPMFDPALHLIEETSSREGLR